MSQIVDHPAGGRFVGRMGIGRYLSSTPRGDGGEGLPAEGAEAVDDKDDYHNGDDVTDRPLLYRQSPRHLPSPFHSKSFLITDSASNKTEAEYRPGPARREIEGEREMWG